MIFLREAAWCPASAVNFRLGEPADRGLHRQLVVSRVEVAGDRTTFRSRTSHACRMFSSCPWPIGITGIDDHWPAIKIAALVTAYCGEPAHTEREPHMIETKTSRTDQSNPALAVPGHRGPSRSILSLPNSSPAATVARSQRLGPEPLCLCLRRWLEDAVRLRTLYRSGGLPIHPLSRSGR